MPEMALGGNPCSLYSSMVCPPCGCAHPELKAHVCTVCGPYRAVFQSSWWWERRSCSWHCHHLSHCMDQINEAAQQAKPLCPGSLRAVLWIGSVHIRGSTYPWEWLKAELNQSGQPHVLSSEHLLPMPPPIPLCSHMDRGMTVDFLILLEDGGISLWRDMGGTGLPRAS